MHKYITVLVKLLQFSVQWPNQTVGNLIKFDFMKLVQFGVQRPYLQTVRNLPKFGYIKLLQFGEIITVRGAPTLPNCNKFDFVKIITVW